MVKMVIERRGDYYLFPCNPITGQETTCIFFLKKKIIQTLTQRREREEEQATIMHLSPSHLPPGVFDQHVYFYG
jgi:hypothetical protein